MAEERVQRRLAAILAADVVGYSRLMGTDETATRAQFNAHLNELIEPVIAHRSGRIVKSLGDGLLVEFASVVDAVQCAVEIQKGMVERNTDDPDDRRIEFRIGVNLGDVIVEGDDIHGDGVNVAARLEGISEPGGICISGKVYEEVRDRTDMALEDLGEREVKNINRPVRVWRWSRADAPASAISSPKLELPDKPSIAVLPFENMSGDPEQEYFADGITEDIITALSRIRQFFVIARNTTFTYKGQAVDVKAVAKDLGVRYILEGSVRKAGNRVRISAQLIDGSTGNHLWAERYDREIADIFDVQDEITQVLVGTIEPELARAEQERAKIKGPENWDAWDTYQRGMWHAQLHQSEEFPVAERLFREAIDLDPNLSPAYSALSELLGRQAFSVSDAPEQAISDALACARKAVQLDPSDAMAKCALGRAYFHDRDSEKAVTELRKAIDLNQSYAHAHFSLGGTLAYSGQAASSIPHLEIARRLSPRDYLLGAMYARQAEANVFLKQYDQAVTLGKIAVNEDGSWHFNYLGYLSALGHLGRLDEAHKVCAVLIAIKEDVSVAFFQQRAPFMNEPDKEHMLEGLRKAGLPE